MIELKPHWEKIFTRRSSSEVSWYKPRLDISLRLIQKTVSKSAPIIDVGGGDSSLVDDLVNDGYSRVTVLDISAAALERARARLGPRAGAVTWMEADITQAKLPVDSFDLWHDRAMFHFLTDPVLRSAYVEKCREALKPAGMLVVATFAVDGPESCSGLPTMRYEPQDIARQFGFRLLESVPELHTTPGGKIQSFVYCVLRKQEQ